MKIGGLKIDFSKLWSCFATVVATGALTALVPPQYKSVAAAVGAVALALHPSPVGAEAAPPAS